MSAGRQYNEVGPQPIAVSELITYLNDIGMVDREERRTFQRLLRALDQQYLELAHEDISRERERLLNKHR